MNLNQEPNETNTIQAYTTNQIQINSVSYEGSLIVSKENIITDVAIKSILELDKQYLDLLLKEKPELILIGHEQTGKLPPMTFMEMLSKLHIGFECMSVGAAARTFNVLLSEHRNVVVGFILE
ncbi:MAG: MTH938/NDUFAF3 family protein [Legionella sp.]